MIKAIFFFRHSTLLSVFNTYPLGQLQVPSGPQACLHSSWHCGLFGLHFCVFWSKEDPSSHWHLEDSAVLTQLLLLPQVILFKHSSKSTHSWMFCTIYPGSQLHPHDPWVFLHSRWQGWSDSHLAPVSPGLQTQNHVNWDIQHLCHKYVFQLCIHWCLHILLVLDHFCNQMDTHNQSLHQGWYMCQCHCKHFHPGIHWHHDMFHHWYWYPGWHWHW